MTTTKCRGCNAEILFITAQNKAGELNAHPVDVKPVKVFVFCESMNEQPTYRLKEGYVSHFATCPNAGQFRKP